MTSKEIIRRVIRHAGAPRLGWHFHDPSYHDIGYCTLVYLRSPYAGKYDEWGDYPEIRRPSGFKGEIRLDVLGNVYGRLGGKTKGECILGALEDGWDGLKDFHFPEIDMARVSSVPAERADKYIIAPVTGIFSSLRDVRRITNALMDTALEPDMVTAFLDRLTDLINTEVALCADGGADGIIMYDDWGTQIAPLIAPASFNSLFKPAYAKVADACRSRGLDFILHSCGKVQALVDDMIDAGIDMFQFDQPELSGVEYWARNYGHKCAFYCPVDIQKIMPTGDRAVIEEGARRMANAFKQNGGALVAKDYGSPESWRDINVKPEWVDWAREAIVANSWMD